MSNIQPREEENNLPISRYDERLEPYDGITIDSPKYRLKYHEREMCVMYTLKHHTGMTSDEIAEKFDTTRANLYRILKKPEAQQFMSDVSNQLLSSLFATAVCEMEKILKTSHSESNKIKVLEMVLKTQGKFKETLDISVKPEHVFDLEREKREIIDIDVDHIDVWVEED
jgi:DNA-binding MarR family transcriptional regulator